MRVGTVFSGIGAIEHALLRMNLDHELVFACDNGDVDIFKQDISVDINSIDKEIKNLKIYLANSSRNGNSNEHGKLLADELEQNEKRYAEVLAQIDELSVRFSDAPVVEVLKLVLAQENIKPLRKKEYAKFMRDLNEEENKNARFLKRLQYSVECVNDFKKDNDLEYLQEDSFEYIGKEFKSRDNIAWDIVIDSLRDSYLLTEKVFGKKIIKQVRDVAERLGMIYEKIKNYQVQQKVDSLKTWEEKKEYIDSLYRPYENKNQVRKSYLANYDLAPQDFHWNVSFFDGKQYAGDLDLFVGGSPCQSFSLVGKQRGLEDTRGTLFYEYARLVKEIKPKVFIYENVKAVLSNDNGRTWETMQQVFDELGYTWKYQVLNAKNYGIPQNRERLFVVGFRNDLELAQEFKFPEPVELKNTMKDFLLDNVSGKYYLPKKGVDFVTMQKNLAKRYTQIDGTVQLCQKKNQQFNWHGDFVFVEENHDMEKTIEELDKYFLSEKVYKYVMATGTKNFYSRPKTDLDVARPLLTTMHKMHRAGVDNYVHTEGRLRKLTPRECLRLMGFCDSFRICVSDTSMYQQAGNSIVVDVLIAVMGEILKAYPALAQAEKKKIETA